MKLTTLFTTSILTGLLSLGIAVKSHAQLSFTYTSLDSPGMISGAWGINNAGTIVGEALNGDGVTVDGYIYKNGQFTSFYYPNAATGSETALKSINSAGVMNGFYVSPTGDQTDFIYNNGAFISPTHAGAIQTFFNFVNDAGEVATVWTDTNGINHSSIYDVASGTFSDLPDANPYGTYIQQAGPNGTNVVNLLNASGGVDGAIYQNGNYTIYNVAGAEETHLDSINNSGYIAGRYVENGLSHGLALYQGQFYTVDYPGATETYIYAINNSNQMVGSYLDANGEFHSLLVQATPEPSSVVLLVGSLFTGAGIFLRRRRTPKA